MRLKNFKKLFSRSKLRESTLAMITNLNVGMLLSGTLLCIKFSFKSFIRFGEEHFLFLQCSNSFVCLQIQLFNLDLNRGCLVYMFSLRFSGSTFLINLRRQFPVRKIFRTQVFVGFAVFSFCV